MHAAALAVTVLCSVFATTGTAAMPGGLEEIVVTAPMHKGEAETVHPVNVLAGEALRRSVAATLGETLKQQVGVSYASFGPGVGHPVIRGQGAPRVLVLQNSLPVGDAANTSADHADATEAVLAERIEVLRGPQGSLYGRNTIGGAINMITAKPKGEWGFKGGLSAGDRDYAKARAELEKRVALSDTGTESRLARSRLLSVLAYLEDWPALGAFAEKELARADLEPMEKTAALGGRALSRIEAGDEEHASRDLQNGLDVVEEQHYGTGGRLPAAAAQLKFVEGEVRRVREEKISFVPVGDDFLAKMNVRCQGLLDAQSSYADAMRSEDPFWATISGYRLGQAYRALHKDLMAIPPTDKAKTEKDKQLFYGIMHVRYRVLLEKGADMIQRTYDFAVKNGDMAWVTRTLQMKKDMELSLEEEKAVIARMPFSEADLQAALKLMEQHYLEKQAKLEAQQKKK